jgi:hypothetical protein
MVSQVNTVTVFDLAIPQSKIHQAFLTTLVKTIAITGSHDSLGAVEIAWSFPYVSQMDLECKAVCYKIFKSRFQIVSNIEVDGKCYDMSFGRDTVSRQRL